MAESDFLLPVDSEHKACIFRPYFFTGVHMRAFHASWMSFFTSFLSTFAPAALAPVLREDLNLNKEDLTNAGIAAVTGTIAARIAMGTVCDTVGPRFGHAFLMLLSAPAVFSMALVTNPAGYIACRFVIGLSLATFVACQFWSSVMFNVKIVGTVNATGAGWGNLGGGVTQIVMPLIFAAIKTSQEPFTAWRYAFFVPGCMHIMVGTLILTVTQDLPDGTYSALRKKGAMNKVDNKVFWIGAKNYRMWVLTITYGYCFGVELTMNNIVVQYFFDQFDLSLSLSGLLGSMFGLMNIFARSIGGLTSDWAAKRWGMRGRLWALWLLQTAEGGLAVVMGLMHNSLGATIVTMVLFSTFVQSAEGASYGVVPFVSKRALGIVSGFVGAGGNAGSSVTQAIFFKDSELETYEGISFMGVMVIGVTLLVWLVYFPMWGGMFCGPKEGFTEEDYYLGEYTKEEIAAGMANASAKFAAESRSQRGLKALATAEEKPGKEVDDTAHAAAVEGKV
ncbi:unnamed protein product [Ostreobium quekettii]|uniref:Nitrate transporter n=1 Tax=Ostreobium quekettii TaxID=121088 RepID=A0A8S1JCV3_9CHLO|nr:unnamed protein product [Ostreobium quekettii]|eukprot:evm.model.scf_373.8 EVM.evm.TU.scf_373.8   scf_373:78536-80449(+)